VVLYSIIYSVILFAIAIGMFYLVYKLIKAEKDVVIEILRYIAAITLSWFAVCSIIAALTYVRP